MVIEYKLLFNNEWIIFRFAPGGKKHHGGKKKMKRNTISSENGDKIERNVGSFFFFFFTPDDGWRKARLKPSINNNSYLHWLDVLNYFPYLDCYIYNVSVVIQSSLLQ